MPTKTTKKRKTAPTARRPNELRAIRESLARWVNREVVPRINDLDMRISEHQEKLKLLDDRQGDAANSSRAMSLELTKHQEQLDMFGHDITNLFAAHGDVAGVEALIKEYEKKPAVLPVPPRKAVEAALQLAYGLISQGGLCAGMDSNGSAYSPVGALKLVSGGSILSGAVHELYRAVDHIWDLTPGEIRTEDMEQEIQLLNEWNDGMVKGVKDVLLALDVAIRTADR